MYFLENSDALQLLDRERILNTERHIFKEPVIILSKRFYKCSSITNIVHTTMQFICYFQMSKESSLSRFNPTKTSNLSRLRFPEERQRK